MLQRKKKASVSTQQEFLRASQLTDSDVMHVRHATCGERIPLSAFVLSRLANCSHPFACRYDAELQFERMGKEGNDLAPVVGKRAR